MVHNRFPILLSWASATFIGGLALVASPAIATTITFDEAGAAPPVFADADPLTDAYAAEGITFSGGWEILDQDGNFGFSALSGRNFLAFNLLNTGITDTLTMEFASPITEIDGQLAARNSFDWTISAFLDDTPAGETVVTNPAGDYVPFSLDGSFDRVTIFAAGDNGVLEDLSFSDGPGGPDPEVIPLPASLPLLLVAFGGAGILARRRR